MIKCIKTYDEESTLDLLNKWANAKINMNMYFINIVHVYNPIEHYLEVYYDERIEKLYNELTNK